MGGGAWQTIRQRFFFSLFCRRPLWVVLEWTGIEKDSSFKVSVSTIILFSFIAYLQRFYCACDAYSITFYKEEKNVIVSTVIIRFFFYYAGHYVSYFVLNYLRNWVGVTNGLSAHSSSRSKAKFAAYSSWRIAWLVGHFWQLPRHGHLHGSGMSHVTPASPKPSFREPWREGDTVVGRGKAGWTTSKSGHPFPCQNCSQGPPAVNTGRGPLLTRPSCPQGYPIGQGTELNWAESLQFVS